MPSLTALRDDGLKEDKPGLSTTPTRRQRVTLLIGSYLDALGPGFHDSVGGSQPGSRGLMHAPLWYEGSYTDIELGLAELKLRAPTVHWHTVEMYVRKSGNRAIRRRKGALGVEFLKRKLPQFIEVPDDVLEGAGFKAERKRAAA